MADEVTVPPFDAGLHARATDIGHKLIKPGGWLYVESGQALEPPAGA